MLEAVQTSALWTPIEQEAWKLPEKLTVSQWADRHRVLDRMTSAIPGQWITDNTPYLREIMDAYTDPLVEEIDLMMSTQVGKTETINNIIGYTIDQDPGPFMFVSARDTDAKNVNKKRVQPMIKLSEALRRHRTGKEDDITKEDLQLDHMTIFFRGANSPAGLASNPIRAVAFDEVDKYPRFAGRESDPIKLGLERTSTFWNRKIILASTPTTRDGYIHRAYERSDRRLYYVPCPHCGEFQVLLFREGVKWPKEISDAEEIRDKRLAWYECQKCHEKIEDRHKRQMLIAGKWVAHGCTINKTGKITGPTPVTRRRGFCINALYSPWKSFSEIAAEFLQSKDKPNELMNFVNSWLAEVWEEKVEETKEDWILKLVQEYETKTVPLEAVVLTAAVDVQKDWFAYSIYAWGANEECWLVSARRAESWDELEKDLFLEEYSGPDGFKVKVRMALFDSGYRTDEVYEFCKRWKDRARPTKGLPYITGVPYKTSKIERNPKTGQVFDGGLLLWLIDTSYFKDKIARYVFSESALEKPKFHVHKDVQPQYVHEMCSEHKVIERDRKTGRTRYLWKLKGEGMRNEYWDCAVLNYAAAEMLRVATIKPDDASKIRASNIRASQPESQPKKSQQPPPGGWLRDTGSWFER